VIPYLARCPVPTVYPMSRDGGDPVIHREGVKRQGGTAFESSPQKKRSPTMTKYGVYSNLITGKILYSTHRTKTGADRACARAGKNGASFVVLPIKK